MLSLLLIVCRVTQSSQHSGANFYDDHLLDL